MKSILYIFEKIHFIHYRNGRMKTVKILGFKSALIDEFGQRKKVVFMYNLFGKLF